MGPKHFKIYWETSAYAWTNICWKYIGFFSIPVWYKLFVWNLLTLSFLLLPMFYVICDNFEQP